MINPGGESPIGARKVLCFEGSCGTGTIGVGEYMLNPGGEAPIRVRNALCFEGTVESVDGRFTSDDRLEAEFVLTDTRGVYYGEWKSDFTGRPVRLTVDILWD